MFEELLRMTCNWKADKFDTQLKLPPFVYCRMWHNGSLLLEGSVISVTMKLLDTAGTSAAISSRAHDIRGGVAARSAKWILSRVNFSRL